jgi:hypothetical protein
MIQYTYYSAATEQFPDKSGVNRITWEDNNSSDQSKWTEITREYFPEDPRTQPSTALQAVMSAKPEELEAIRQILGIN